MLQFFRAIKRKGFGEMVDKAEANESRGGSANGGCKDNNGGPSLSRRESAQTPGGANLNNSGNNIHNNIPARGTSRTSSAPLKNKDGNGSTNGGPPNTAPPGVSTPFFMRKSTTPEGIESTSPSQASSVTAHSNEGQQTNKENNVQLALNVNIFFCVECNSVTIFSAIRATF